MKTPLLSAFVALLACGQASALGQIRVQAARVGPQHIGTGFAARGLALTQGSRTLLPYPFGGTPLLHVAPELRQGLALSADAKSSALGVGLVHAGPTASVASRLQAMSFSLGDAARNLSSDSNSDDTHGTGRQLEKIITGADYEYRPPVEWWTVGTQRFDSTSALLASGVADHGPVPAVHHYRPSPARLGAGRWLGTAAGGLAGGGFVLGALGFLLESFGAILGTVTFTAIRADADILAGTLFFGVFGAVVGLGAALHGMRGLARDGMTRAGSLTKEGGTLIFRSGRRTADLGRHAQAEVFARRKLPGGRSGMLLGALLVPAFLLLSFIPLVNILLPLAVGGTVGHALAAGRNTLFMLPALAGAAVAAAAAVALWAGISSLGWAAMAPWLLGATLVLALLGALFGGAIKSGLDYAERTAGTWWSADSDDPAPAPKKR